MNPVTQMIESVRIAGTKIQLPTKRQIMESAAVFTVCLLAGRAQLAGEFAPFATAAFAAMFLIGMPPAAFLGCIAGCMLRLSWSGTFAIALFMVIALVLKKVSGKFYRRQILLAVFVAEFAAVFLFKTKTPYQFIMGMFACVAAVILTSVYLQALRLFQTLRRRKLLADEELIALCIAAGTLILGIADVKIVHVAPSAILVGIATLMMGSLGGAGMGAATGISLGAMLAAGGEIKYMMTIGLSGLVCGSVNKLGKACSALGFVVAGAALVFYTRQDPAILINIVLSAVIFLLLPAPIYNEAGKFVSATVRRDQSRRDYITRLQELSAKQLTEFSDVFLESGRIFKDNRKKNPAGWDIETLLPVCKGCSNEKNCWSNPKELGEEYISVLSNPPGRLLSQCRRLHTLRPMINALSMSAAREEKLVTQLNTTREMTGKQLIGVSEVMTSLSERLQRGVLFDDMLESKIMAQLDKLNIRFLDVCAQQNGSQLTVSIECAACSGECERSIKKAVDAACKRPMRMIERNCEGKCHMVFEQAHRYEVKTCALTKEKSTLSVLGDSWICEGLSEGRYLIAISDGMGSGKKAARESQAVLVLLKKLFAANISQNVALDVVNRLLILRSTEEMYSTLDCCCIDLLTGAAQFIKQGAMPTYLFSGDEIKQIAGESLPVGILEEAQPSVEHVQLQVGDYLFFMSDGVHDAIGPQIKQTIAAASATSVEVAAQIVLSRAQSTPADDDMTIIAAQIVTPGA